MKKAFSSQFGKQFGKFGKANFFSKDSSTVLPGYRLTEHRLSLDAVELLCRVPLSVGHGSHFNHSLSLPLSPYLSYIMLYARTSQRSRENCFVREDPQE